MNTNYGTPISTEEQKVDKIVFAMKITACLLGIIFVLIGVYHIFFKFESAFEIKNINSEISMEVYKRSYIPPFKEKDFVINNIKTSAVDPAQEKRSIVKYSISVEDVNNNKTNLPIKSYSYKDQKNLSEKINNAIKNNENFKFADKNNFDKILALLFILVGLSSLLISYLFLEKIVKPALIQNLKSSGN